MCAKFANCVQVNGAVVYQYGTLLQTEANKNLPICQQLSLSFSIGCVNRFQDCHGIRFRWLRGDAAPAHISAVNEDFPNMCGMMASFAKGDLRNVDKTGSLYFHPPGWSLSASSIQGITKEKKRLTYLACCSFGGIEKYPLMEFGRASRLRPFKKSSGTELDFDSYANQMAWMTNNLFFSWLERFDSNIGQTSGQQFLTLFDNCSAHGGAQVVPKLRNVELLLPLRNFASRIQPLDAWTIADVKEKYRRRLLFRVFDNIGAGAKTIYNVDILTAMRCVRKEWLSLHVEAISNCWNHCFESASPGSFSDIVSEVYNNLRD